MKAPEKLKQLRAKIKQLQLEVRTVKSEMEIASGKKQRPDEASRIKCWRRNGEYIGTGRFYNDTRWVDGCIWRGVHVEYEDGRKSTWLLVNRWEPA